MSTLNKKQLDLVLISYTLFIYIRSKTSAVYFGQSYLIKTQFRSSGGATHLNLFIF